MKTLKKMSDEVRNQESKDNISSVLMPNDPQINFSKERTKDGIPVMENILEILF